MAQIIKIIFYDGIPELDMVCCYCKSCACTGSEARNHSVVVIPHDFGPVSYDKKLASLDFYLLSVDTAGGKLHLKLPLDLSIENLVQIIVCFGFDYHFSAANPLSRSAMMSSMCSIPIESLMVL